MDVAAGAWPARRARRSGCMHAGRLSAGGAASGRALQLAGAGSAGERRPHASAEEDRRPILIIMAGVRPCTMAGACGRGAHGPGGVGR